MRILQIIDTLQAGGAEKMAVNYANSLAEKGYFSGLVVTREEGVLKNKIDDHVNYFFLDRKKTFDIIAVLKLKHYCIINKIDYLQAHGSSFFIAILVKLFIPKIKILWHDHSGERSNQDIIKNKTLFICSFFFEGIIVVNHSLKQWCEKKLKTKKIIYLPNFTIFSPDKKEETVLNGKEGKRILCLANLRNPKNHEFLLKVSEKVIEKYPDWSFHLVGKDYNDEYSTALKLKIIKKKLQNNVYIYGQKNDIEFIIQQSTICVLTSSSEGLPVALLEYGLLKKPVVTTDVGEIPLIIKNEMNGFIVTSNDEILFFKYLENLILNENLRNNLGVSLHKTISENNSKVLVLDQFIRWIKKI